MQSTLITAILLFACQMPGAESVGTVSCPGPMKLGGIVTDVPGVLAWAVLDGDVLETQAMPAVLTLDDGTVMIAAASKVRLEGRDATTLVLLEGRVDAFFRKNGRLTIREKGRSIPVPGGQPLSVSHSTAAVGRAPTIEPVPTPPAWLLRRFVYSWRILPEAYE